MTCWSLFFLEENNFPSIFVELFEEGDPVTNHRLVSPHPDKICIPLFMSRQPALLAEKNNSKLMENLTSLNFPADFFHNAIKVSLDS